MACFRLCDCLFVAFPDLFCVLLSVALGYVCGTFFLYLNEFTCSFKKIMYLTPSVPSD